MLTIGDERNDKPQRRIELKFRWIPGPFAVCHLPADAVIPDWALRGVFNSVTRTSDELSIVCHADNLPADVNAETHWMCFKIEGPFAFSEVGILAAFIDPLIRNRVPVFAISTFDTDYVLVSEEFAGVALGALQEAGHELWPKDESWRKLIE